jgi:hypothetical protein
MNSGSECSADRRKPETFFQRLGHRASEKKDFGPNFLKLIQILRELFSAPEGHFVPENPASAGKKGQPDGSAIKSKTRKPGAADQDLVSGNAAGQNNSNLTP